MFSMVIISTYIPPRVVDNYLSIYPLACTIGLSVLLVCFLSFTGSNTIKLGFADLLLTIIVCYYLCRYNYVERLADWKIYYAILLLIFWFTARIILSNYLGSKRNLIIVIIIMGCLQVIWGIFQLYELLPSYNEFYAITGSFYNPGPYTGYVGMFIPLCVYQILNTYKKEKCFWIGILALLICIIPAGMSRIAWIAIIVGIIFVFMTYFKLFLKLRLLYKNNRLLFIFYSFVFMFICFVILYQLFIMRPMSVYGRLFIWKITLFAILKQALWGYGPGSFPYIYGKEQSSYFSSVDYSWLEEPVAGAPEYAFNEYLQFLIEGGVILFLLIIAFIIYCFRVGIKRKQYGVCASLLTFCLFAFASYPMQVLAFGPIVIIFIAVLVSKYEHIEGQSQKKRKSYLYILLLLLLVVSIPTIYILRKSISVKRDIVSAQQMCAVELYEDGINLVSRNYSKIFHNPYMLQNYAFMYIKRREYSKAIKILNRAEKVGCSPNILYLKAFCYEKIRDVVRAELTYKEAINRIPIKLYPYYMLTKLYSKYYYNDKNRVIEMAQIALNKKLKKESVAGNEMKEEIHQILDRYVKTK